MKRDNETREVRLVQKLGILLTNKHRNHKKFMLQLTIFVFHNFSPLCNSDVFKISSYLPPHLAQHLLFLRLPSKRSRLLLLVWILLTYFKHNLLSFNYSNCVWIPLQLAQFFYPPSFILPTQIFSSIFFSRVAVVFSELPMRFWASHAFADVVFQPLVHL